MTATDTPQHEEATAGINDDPEPTGASDNTAYAPMAWNGVFPAASSIIASYLATANSVADQFQEATKLNTMIINQDNRLAESLHSITSPLAMLIQVPGTCTLRVIFGLSKYVENPLAPANGLHGKFLALGEDVTDPMDTPNPVHLPDDILTSQVVGVPSDAVFLAELTRRATSTTDVQHDQTQWFKSSTVTGRATLAKVVPIPLYLAYDLCQSDVTAHTLWERCKIELEALQDQDDGAILRTIMAFCKATHTKHGVNNATTSLPMLQLSQKVHPDAKVWAKARVRSICPQFNAPAPRPNMITPPLGQQGDTSDLASTLMARILEKLGAQKEKTTAEDDQDNNTSEDSDDLIYKKYGLRGHDMEVFLKQCGKETGQEEELPVWRAKMAAKNLTDDGKYRIAMEMLRTVRYEDHPVKPHPAILKMITKGKFTGEGSQTATAVMTGLTPYLLVDLTDDAVHQAQEYDTALKLATATTLADIRKQTKVAKVPPSFIALADTLKCYANLILAIYGPFCPLLQQLTSLISSMMKMEDATKRAMDKQTIASIMWVVFLQSRRFTNGEIDSNDDTDMNWLDVRQKLLTASAIHRNDIPIGITGRPQFTAPLPPTPDGKKRDKPDGDPPTPSDRNISHRFQIHPKVAGEIAARLPPKFSLRNAMERKKITKDIFGIPNLCSQAAIFGLCRNKWCTRDHSVSKVDDAAADKAIATLAPIFAEIEKSGKPK